MNRLKVCILFSTIISLLMCALSSSVSLLYSRNIINYDAQSLILNEIFSKVFSFKDMLSLNIILTIIFLVNSVSLVLYLFKMDTKATKHFSFFSISLLIMGLSLFVLYVISFITFYDLYAYCEYFTLKFRISSWIPRILIFCIPTLYLLAIQVYLIKKAKSIKLNKKFIIFSIYLVCIIFLTIVTFFEFSMFTDQLLGYLRLKTCAIIIGDIVYGETYVNIVFYIYYFILFTIISGCLLISSKYKRMK